MDPAAGVALATVVGIVIGIGIGAALVLRGIGWWAAEPRAAEPPQHPQPGGLPVSAIVLLLVLAIAVGFLVALLSVRAR